MFLGLGRCRLALPPKDDREGMEGLDGLRYRELCREGEKYLLKIWPQQNPASVFFDLIIY